MQATIVFEKNWNAIGKRCGTCNGVGKLEPVNGKQPICEGCNGSGNYYRYIINRGSSRSSKTVSLIQLMDLYARNHSYKRMTIWRDTKTDCKKTVLVDMLKQLKRTNLYKVEQEFNKTESIFTYKNDSTIEIHGTDDEETVHGLTQDCAWLNEPYKISQETFNQIDQRTSDFIFIDYNPKKGHWVEDLIKDSRAIVIDSTFKDNPFCPPEQRTKILSYQPVKACALVESKQLTEMEAKDYDYNSNPSNFTDKEIKELIRTRENEGKNSANLFNWQVYGLGLKSEKPNRIFNWKEVSVDQYNQIDVPRYIGNDWGAVDPWGIIEAKYLDGKLYLHELNYDSENTIRERLTATERSQIGYSEEQIETGLVTWMYGKLGISKRVPIICDTNRPIKIAALRRSGYNASPASKGKGSILDGVDLLNNLEVFYTSTSINLKYEQENYSRKVDRYGVIQDEPEDCDNHLIDPTRYICEYLRQKRVIRQI